MIEVKNYFIQSKCNWVHNVADTLVAMKIYLPFEPLDKLCRLWSLPNKVFRPDTLLAQQTMTLVSMELPSFVPAMSLACHSYSMNLESFEVNGKGPWLQGTLDHVWCTRCFDSSWISYTADHHVCTYSVSWHILTQEWDWKCVPSSKYSISVTQVCIWKWSLHI